MKGVFITFEGIEGAGKSTQARKLKEYLEYIGKKVILTREPGGTKIGLKIREIVLSHWDEIFPNIAELLLYEADRNIHIYNVIKPKLEEGYIVISDRFIDSTVAYQHFARGIDRNIVDYLNNLATDGLKPDITFLIDIPVSESLKRLKDKDRIEQEDITFHQKLREGFLKIAEEEKDRFIILDGTENENIIFDKIINILSAKKII
ncbi:dTMP kinase [Venenivibrio stagnispumantis]|uniref:Thymidylate kinase n=1 Tax=Venenivibrio stagnispumantis TaxID=407998 RepID=A0AA45WNE3_9AQUI|nr:dTMP kinase [Venenivibrio stagnispumantis]MCW4573177.1 dTMP kinase [Venenivibrio stagnispumantis]SMP17807.1 dTMP kinase [Venenivibrio stagnispumantis]